MSVKPEHVEGPGLDPGIDPAPPPPAKPFIQYQQRLRERQHTNSNLQHITSLTSPELLEEATAVGLKALDDLKPPLDAVACLPTTQAAQWITLIDELKAKAKPTRTIVGVVGNTGAGKSSVISAVLDEERLLPTNCMRACTASPTEISYNYSDKPDELYRAEVEFITADEWKSELEALYVDVIDPHGEVSRDTANADSEAGIAYAKIKAVYPKKTKEMVAKATPQDLVNEPLVRGLLGTSKKLKALTADSIYKQLQVYVDSKEKTKEKLMEYWPLIKVVRIYTKSDALATGAYLVDLPGVQDSNAARAAVATNYMKSCTALWIVAPINRAVDDKTAKSLLGDSFKRQLKYDGIYSAVTFICSKTDDVSVTEAVDSLDLDDEFEEYSNKLDAKGAELKRLKEKNQALKDEKEALDDLIEASDKIWDKWEALGKRVAKGKTVYAPLSPKSPLGKRKRTTKPQGACKDQTSADSAEDEDSDSDDISDDYSSDEEMSDDGSDKENSHPIEKTRSPLTEDDIDKKMAEIKANKKELRAQKKAKDQQMAANRAQAKRLQAEKEVLKSEIKALCIQGRNAYSREAIKKDFALGIKELDQEAAAEQDEANFDPEVDQRDYDAVGRSLPVFCVSSRAFHGLSGRLKKDNINCSGFNDVQDTEIPQLQAHARKLTESSRLSNSRRFLNDMQQLLNSMMMCATNDGTQSALTDGDKMEEENHLRAQLKQIELDLHAVVNECSHAIHDALVENIFEQFDRNIGAAVQAAVPTAVYWGAHKDAGGMVWSTYKATCRRNGVFSGASGARDLNAELFEPVSVNLANSWEKAFQRRLPTCLNSFARNAQLLIETFHNEAICKTQKRGLNMNGLNMLNNQLRTLCDRITAIPGTLNQLVQELQRDTNRNFSPEIQKAMLEAYARCVEERGSGSFARMKTIMVSHVQAQRHDMFHNAINVVRCQIEDINRRITDQMLMQVIELHSRISQDYLASLFGAAIVTELGIPRAEKMVRREMIPLLEEVDSKFSHLVPLLSIKKEYGLLQEALDQRYQFEEARNDDGDDETLILNAAADAAREGTAAYRSSPFHTPPGSLLLGEHVVHIKEEPM